MNQKTKLKLRQNKNLNQKLKFINPKPEPKPETKDNNQSQIQIKTFMPSKQKAESHSQIIKILNPNSNLNHKRIFLPASPNKMKLKTKPNLAPNLKPFINRKLKLNLTETEP